MNTQRQGKKATGKSPSATHSMVPERAAALETVPGWAWAPRAATWQERLEELEAHVAACGALPPQDDPSGLGQWVGRQRSGTKAMDAGKTGTAREGMTPARAAALEAVPSWARELDPEALWQARLEELKTHMAAGDAAGLGEWAHNQRQDKRAANAGRPRGDRPPERAAALERVPCWAWAASRKRRRRGAGVITLGRLLRVTAYS
jgi:hypothetical protein